MHYEAISKTEKKKLEKLREIIHDHKLPRKTLDSNLLISTFNIRKFGNKPRESYAINALAEICSNFDIIAIQELRSNLDDLDRLMKVLGNHWKAIFNDPAGEAMNPGNDERLGYLYDSRKLTFTGMAAELMVTDDFLKTAGIPDDHMSVPWRVPYMVSFKTSTFDFVLLTVHIQWNSKGGITARSKEIEMITNWIGNRVNKAKIYDPDIFVLGDFNIPSIRSKTFKALEEHGLVVHKKLRKIKTNLKQNAHYDQIAYYEQNTDCEVSKAGVINFYDAFFKDDMPDSAYKALTFQLSDHLPLWAEFKINEVELDKYVYQ